MTIYDLVQAEELALYWTTLTQDRAPYLGETLFPNDKKLGLDLKWIKGKSGLPVVLKLSAFDVKAVPRDRIGFSKESTQMPFFKESLLIDEEMRQELNKVLETGNQAYIDAVMNRVFDDDTRLIESAAVSRERMRMMLLTTGIITMTSNGQTYTYDYGLTSAQKPTVTKSWSDSTADIINDIKTWQDDREDETGVRPTRALISRKTFNYILKNETIAKSVYVLSNGQAALTENRAKQYIMDETGVEIVVYTKKYKNELGAVVPYIPDDTFVLFPTGQLGKTWFGTTPEESDLLSGSVANVSVVDTGVAVTTMKIVDPVNVETKVTMISLPSFEAADQIVIADVIV